jgi:hypothetical protein
MCIESTFSSVTTQISTNSMMYIPDDTVYRTTGLVHTSYEISWDAIQRCNLSGHLFKYPLKLLPGVYTLGKDLYNPYAPFDKANDSYSLRMRSGPVELRL